MAEQNVRAVKVDKAEVERTELDNYLDEMKAMEARLWLDEQGQAQIQLPGESEPYPLNSKRVQSGLRIGFWEFYGRFPKDAEVRNMTWFLEHLAQERGERLPGPQDTADVADFADRSPLIEPIRQWARTNIPAPGSKRRIRTLDLYNELYGLAVEYLHKAKQRFPADHAALGKQLKKLEKAGLLRAYGIEMIFDRLEANNGWIFTNLEGLEGVEAAPSRATLPRMKATDPRKNTEEPNLFEELAREDEKPNQP